MTLREQFEKETGLSLYQHWRDYIDWLENKMDSAIFDPVCKDCGDPLVSNELICNVCNETKFQTLLITVKETLEENLNLCDGEDCTLKKLRDAVEAEGE